MQWARIRTIYWAHGLSRNLRTDIQIKDRVSPVGRR